MRMSSEDYKCTLDKEELKKAGQELNEDPKNRLGSVETFRTWIRQQEHLKCITDTGFLLRFLRHAKFSQLRVREVLENYLRLMTKYPQFLQNIDSASTGCVELISRGVIVPMPGYDEEGRKVIIFNPGMIDTTGKTHTLEDILRVWFAVLLSQLDEHVQVYGIVLLIDHTQFTMKHMTYVPIDYIKKHVEIFMNSFPVRYGVIHVYNAGPVFEMIFAAIKPILRAKIRDRIHVHGSNLETVYKHIPMHLLPSEYLPDEYQGPSPGKLQDVISEYQGLVASETMRQKILLETGPAMNYDASKRDNSLPQESFRQLNID